jgi:hypothetical protein
MECSVAIVQHSSETACRNTHRAHHGTHPGGCLRVLYPGHLPRCRQWRCISAAIRLAQQQFHWPDLYQATSCSAVLNARHAYESSSDSVTEDLG